MIGKPKYRVGDRVCFKLGDETKHGVVYVVDAYGTFMQSDDVSYDVFVEKPGKIYRENVTGILYKHIMEPHVWKDNEGE